MTSAQPYLVHDRGPSTRRSGSRARNPRLLLRSPRLRPSNERLHRRPRAAPTRAQHTFTCIAPVVRRQDNNRVSLPHHRTPRSDGRRTPRLTASPALGEGRRSARSRRAASPEKRKAPQSNRTAERGGGRGKEEEEEEAQRRMESGRDRCRPVQRARSERRLQRNENGGIGVERRRGARGFREAYVTSRCGRVLFGCASRVPLNTWTRTEKIYISQKI